MFLSLISQPKNFGQPPPKPAFQPLSLDSSYFFFFFFFPILRLQTSERLLGMAFLCKTQVHVLNFSFVCTLFSLFLLCHAANSITKGQSIQDGDTLISENEIFKLGFFSPENSELRYLGIWYYEIQDQAVIWVANREKPISDKNGVFTIGEDGNLVVRDGNGSSVWSSHESNISSTNTTAILQATGNLVLSSAADTSEAYWESFNHPTDTYLPNMKVLVDSALGENHCFRSWKSVNDPSPGNFTMGVDPRGAPQIVIWENSRRIWRSGHWDDQIFIGVPSMIALTNFQYGFKLSRADDGKDYFTYNPSDPSDLLRFKILWNGTEEQLKWNGSERKWDVMQSQPINDCEIYNFCGNFGVCRASDSPKCICMEGYEPSFLDQWRNGNWSGGCRRRSALKCEMNTSIGAQDDFKELRSLKLPDFAEVFTRDLANLDKCEEKCLNNCSCNAYAVVRGIGCMIWTGDLIDMQEFDRNGNTLFLRIADSEFGGRRLSTAVIVIIVVAGLIFLALSAWLLWRCSKKLKVLPKASSVPWPRKNEIPLAISDVSKSGEYSNDVSGPADLVIRGSQVNGPDLPLFNFSCVADATNNFSNENKLGEGGFGPVYKGKLPGGEEIAVKRLSRISGQGLEEFKNEIILIAKLQHRNLVRLLGCCIQGEEKMLLYEYMANKSLDCFLFDPARQRLLDWTKRFVIIEGIARGLLYLHRDSRLRIIHRDLKASNILLDEDMNPKISDFGMARIFGGNQNEANTNRVVGTYGYMSPEYAMEGLFSVKSDVYSFGVLVMEIISGRRNTSFRVTDHVLLIAYAWQLWSEGNAMELVDPSIRDLCPREEVLRCIQIAMLCVQDSAIHRPTMAHVLLMLESDAPLPWPGQPTFNSMRASTDTELFLDSQDIVSSSDLTDTVIVGR